MLTHTQAESALLGPGPGITAVRSLFGEMLQQPKSQRMIAAGLAGADVRFDMGGAAEAGPTGWFVPPFELVTDDGATRRVAEVLRDGQPVLLDLTGRTDLAAAQPWAERVRQVAASLRGTHAGAARPARRVRRVGRCRPGSAGRSAHTLVR